jgi:serine/threonine protein kinase
LKAHVSAPPADDERTVQPAAGGASTARAPRGGNALPAGSRIGEFEIVGLVGEGGFGIVYLAYDHSLERNIALKEYMPASLAQRREGGWVTVKSNRAETFALGMRSFINEAKLLAQFDHPSLVKVYRFREANGTAYMAMRDYEGERQCYHRDIAPDNVLMLPGDIPVLLDFGAARRVLTDGTQALTVILKPGYAPIEQYAESPDMKQGAWTDLYALAAVIYFAIAGRPPEPAVARVISDPVEPLTKLRRGRYSETFLSAIDAAMSVRPEDRPQNIAQFLEALGFRARERDAISTQPPRMAPAAPASPSTAAAPSIAPADAAALEALLARAIGPLAKIIVARAQASSVGREDLFERLAASIDREDERAGFLAAARRIVTR